jgi:hypothetical protein
MKRAADVLSSAWVAVLLVSAFLIFEHDTEPVDFVVARVFFGAHEHVGETIDRFGSGCNVQ